MLRRLFRAAGAGARRWPAGRQFTELGRGSAATSERPRGLSARLHGARTVGSICPYCAVGCATLIHVKDGQIVDVEGDPESPINEGTLCPKGAGIFQYTVNPRRLTRVLYRRPYGTEWEEVEIGRAS